MEIKYKVEVKEYTMKLAEDDKKGLSSPDRIFDCLKGDFNPLQEELYVLCLNAKNDLLEKKLVFKGGMSSLNISPSDIFRNVLLSAGNKFVMAHNHPSGNPEPSPEDVHATNKIIAGAKLLGLDMLDHIVYTNDAYISMRGEGLM